MVAQTRITAPVIRSYKQADKRFVMLTAYDYLTATAFDQAGVPILLVGDTLGMFVQGHDTPLTVTMDAMVGSTGSTMQPWQENAS